ncbi:MAG: sigma-70 family RNA polymerase sigma factor [Bacteroidota bacterium]
MAKLPWQAKKKPESDKNVFKAFLEGDDRLISSFYHRAKQELVPWLSSRGIPKSEQSDLIQEAMITLFKKIRDRKIQAEQTPSLLAYLKGILRFLILRSRGEQAKASFVELDLDRQVSESEIEGPEMAYYEKLGRLLKQVSPSCQELLELVYYQKKSYAEIATILSKDQGTLKTTKYRCIQKLIKLKAQQDGI